MVQLDHAQLPVHPLVVIVVPPGRLAGRHVPTQLHGCWETDTRFMFNTPAKVERETGTGKPYTLNPEP